MFNLHVLVAALAAPAPAPSRTVWAVAAAAGVAADALAGFAAEVNTATGGRLKLTPSEAPFETQDLLNAIQAGQLQAGAVPVANVPAEGDSARLAALGCVLLRARPHAVLANREAFEALDAPLRQALLRPI